MPPRVTKEQLRFRWSSVIDEYIRPPKQWGRSGRRKQFDLAGLVRDEPFGRFEGRVDLRCLDMTSHFVLVETAELGSVDLTDARFDNADFEEPTWNDFLLARTRLTNSAIRAGHFEDCQFHRSQLGGSFLGTRSWGTRVRSTYANCAFTKARTSMSLGDSDFRSCTFDSPQGRIEPGTATFADCTFTGRLHDFEFRTGWPSSYRPRERRGPTPHNTMRNVDLSQAVLSFVSFHGLDLTSVKLDEERQFLITDWPALRARMSEIPRAVAEEKGGMLWYFEQASSPAVADLAWIEEEFAPGSAEVIQRAMTR